MNWLSKLLIPQETSEGLYKRLRDAVADRIVPYLLSCNFLEDEKPLFPNITKSERNYSPFNIFRRKCDDYDDIVEIVFDEQCYPEFYLMAGQAPHSGVEVWGKPISLEKIGISESLYIFSLSSRSGKFRPFTLTWPFAGERHIPDIVSHALMLAPQLICWLDTLEVGPNLVGGRNECARLLRNSVDRPFNSHGSSNDSL